MIMNFKPLGFDKRDYIQWGGIRWDIETSARLDNPLFLERYGYKVYSQNDEDGIIQEIFKRIGITNKKFVEFGVQDGTESNSHYLLFLDWAGLWIEGSKEYVNEINNKFNQPIKNGKLRVLNSFITRENINSLIESQGITGEIDLLSIDIDGNDYYIFEEINCINPRVIIAEYNAKFPPECEWRMMYDKDFVWSGSDKHSASLKAFEKLAEKKGYNLVGTNAIGVNAFFVRKDLTKNLFATPPTAENLYNPPRFHIRYKSGYECNKCLVDDQTDFQSFLSNEKIEYFIAHGFDMLEKSNLWMNNLKAKIYFKVNTKNRNKLKVEYSTCDIEKLGEKGLELNIYINNFQFDANIELLPEGSFVLNLQDKYVDCEFIEIDFNISRLWKPSDVYGTTDQRSLGFNLKKIEMF